MHDLKNFLISQHLLTHTKGRTQQTPMRFKMFYFNIPLSKTFQYHLSSHNTPKMKVTKTNVEQYLNFNIADLFLPSSVAKMDLFVAFSLRLVVDDGFVQNWPLVTLTIWIFRSFIFFTFTKKFSRFAFCPFKIIGSL